MSGNIFFKSAGLVMELTGSFSNIVTLIVQLDPKETFNLPIPFSFFTLISQTTIVDTDKFSFYKILCPQEGQIQSDPNISLT